MSGHTKPKEKERGCDITCRRQMDRFDRPICLARLGARQVGSGLRFALAGWLPQRAGLCNSAWLVQVCMIAQKVFDQRPRRLPRASRTSRLWHTMTAHGEATAGQGQGTAASGAERRRRRSRAESCGGKAAGSQRSVSAAASRDRSQVRLRKGQRQRHGGTGTTRVVWQAGLAKGPVCATCIGALSQRQGELVQAQHVLGKKDQTQAHVFGLRLTSFLHGAVATWIRSDQGTT